MKKITFIIMFTILISGCTLKTDSKESKQDYRITELKEQISELEKEKEILKLENEVEKLKEENDIIQKDPCLKYGGLMLEEVRSNKTQSAKVIEIFYSQETENCYYISDVGDNIYFLNNYTKGEEITMVACSGNPCYKTAFKDRIKKLNGE